MRRDHLGGSDLAIWQSAYSPTVKLIVESDQRKNLVRIEGAIKNTTKGNIYVFKEDIPLVRIWPGGEVWIMSLMPIMVPWSRPIAPHIPAAHWLQVGEILEFKAMYNLPMRETHPYPSAPVTRAPIPTEMRTSSDITMVYGYFLESDGNRLFDGVKPGVKVPGYYDLKRQFLISSEPLQLHLPIVQPIL